MKAVTTFLLLVILSFGAHAADRPDRKLAIEYLKVSRFEQIINASLDTYSQQKEVFLQPSPFKSDGLLAPSISQLPLS